MGVSNVKGIRLCSAALAAAALLAAQDLGDLEKRVTDFTLANGLHFLVVERHDSPTVAFHTYVRAGSANDGAGHTGLAYLFERVTFAGTGTIGSNNWPEEKKALDAVEELYDQLEAEKGLGAKASTVRIDTLESRLRIAIDTARRHAQPGAYMAILD